MSDSESIYLGPIWDALDEDDEEDSKVIEEFQFLLISLFANREAWRECLDNNDIGSMMDVNATLRQAELTFIRFCEEKLQFVPPEFADMALNSDLYHGQDDEGIV